MALFGFFRRQPPIREIKQLADFIDAQSAYLIQKGIHDYSNARAGPHAKVLMSEPEFVASLEQSRWRAYPLGLAMVGEMVEGVLRPHAGADKRALTDEHIDLVLGVFDRYPVPDAVGKEAWRDARAELALRLDQISMHPPKRVIDIPEQYVKRYFEMMPIHESMRTRDIGTTLGYLKLTLVNMHTELNKRMDAAAMAQELRKGGRRLNRGG